jgi:predicted heme/steroid binding protein
MARDTDSTLRNRKPAKDEDDRVVEVVDDDGAPLVTTKSQEVALAEEEDEKYSPWLDILRVITFLLVASCALSYLVSNGESWTWGKQNKPRYLRLDWWKTQFTSPLLLTPDELAAFDGTDPEKPIYLAINGTIYDVTAGARMYGPGGGYHGFAGRDASRSFVTGCFSEDRTPDMRGVEEMFIPNDDGVDMSKYWTEEELAELRQKELENAHKRVYDGLAHWIKFFGNSDKYVEVGKVKREDGWIEKMPRRKLCKTAFKARPKRKIPEDRKNRT